MSALSGDQPNGDEPAPQSAIRQTFSGIHAADMSYRSPIGAAEGLDIHASHPCSPPGDRFRCAVTAMLLAITPASAATSAPAVATAIGSGSLAGVTSVAAAGATDTVPTLAARLAAVKAAKQINYYPSTAGWSAMWTSFDAAKIDADLAKAPRSAPTTSGPSSSRSVRLPDAEGRVHRQARQVRQPSPPRTA